MEDLDLTVPTLRSGEAGATEKLNKFMADVKNVLSDLALRGIDSTKVAALDAAVVDFQALRADVKAMQDNQAVRSLDDVSGDERGLSAYLRPEGREFAPNLRTVDSEGNEVRRSAAEGKLHKRVRLFAEDSEALGWVPGLLDDPNPSGRWQKDLQRMFEEKCLIEIATGKVARKARARLDAHLSLAPAPIKRIFADVATSGQEWYPSEILLPLLDQELMLTASRRIEGLFGVTPMSNKVVSNPFLSSGLRPYLKGTSTTDDPALYTASSATTAERSRTAVGWAVRTQIDDDASEDSVLDNMSILRDAVINALVDGGEDAIINADSTATHQDAIASWDIRGRWGSTGLGTAADHRRAWIGLRARAVDVSATTDGTSVQTYAGYLAERGALDAPHGTAGKLAMLVSDEYYIKKLLGFSEVVTLEKYGPGATIMTGEVGKIGGAPVVVTQFLSADMANTGLYTGSGALSGYLVVNCDRFKMGVRRGPTVEMYRDPRRGTRDIVATARKVFYTIDSSTKKNLRYVYNVG